MKTTIYLAILFGGIINTAICQQSKEHVKLYKNDANNWSGLIKDSDSRLVDSSYNVNFYHLDIEVSIDAKNKYIKGNVRCDFSILKAGINQISMDLNNNLKIDSIIGNCLGFSHINNKITITLNRKYSINEKASVQIYYQGKPKMAGGYKGLVYEKNTHGAPVIATLSTPYIAHYWYPCKDGPADKADSVYVDITIKDTVINNFPMKAVSNGKLEKVIKNTGKVKYCWRHRYPIVPYYVMIAISNYDEIIDEFSYNGDTMPLVYYVFNEDKAEAEHGVKYIPEVIGFFSDIYGQYPFMKEKYGMTQLGFYGAIENQTNTITNTMDSSWFTTSVHELAHMWFADMITCSDWHHGWVNEGFATYSEALWAEHWLGKDAYDKTMASKNFYGKGTVYLQNAADTFNIFSEIIYYKGAWVLHMLRGELGDSTFFSILKRFATDERFVYKNASTDDFIEICEQVSGKELNWFFDQWIYEEYYPRFKYNFTQDESTNELQLRVVQRQVDNGWKEVFDVSLHIKILFEDGTDTLLVQRSTQKDQLYSFDLDKKISSKKQDLKIDWGNWILSEELCYSSLPVKIKEQELGEFTIYPNPVNNNKVFVTCTESALNKGNRVSIYTLSGELLLQKQIEEVKMELSLQYFSPGIYILKIADEVHKIILQ